MPTGYTSGVQDGTVTEFADFAKRCARAFGAFYSLRDEDDSKELPTRFDPDTRYHDQSLAQALAERARLDAMAPHLAEAEARLEYDQQMQSYRERREAASLVRSRYDAMLAKVQAWTPPTPEHDDLKAFMIQQLTDSIQYDAIDPNEPSPVQPGAWLVKRKARVERDIAYHTSERNKEIERNASRNAWIAAFFESLK